MSVPVSTKARICRWPHCGMSAAEERRFEVLVDSHIDFIRRAARHAAHGGGGVDASDLVQEALIMLWRMGPLRALARGDAYVRGAVIKRMQKVRFDDWRKWGRRSRSFQPEAELTMAFSEESHNIARPRKKRSTVSGGRGRMQIVRPQSDTPSFTEPVGPAERAFVEHVVEEALAMARGFDQVGDPEPPGWLAASSVLRRWLRDRAAVRMETLPGLLNTAVGKACRKANRRAGSHDGMQLRYLAEHGLLAESYDGVPSVFAKETADGDLMRDDMRNATDLAIALLGEPLTTLVQLSRFDEEITHAEMAAIAGVPRGSVAYHLTVAATKLSAMMKPYMAGDQVPPALHEQLRQRRRAGR